MNAVVPRAKQSPHLFLLELNAAQARAENDTRPLAQPALGGTLEARISPSLATRERHQGDHPLGVASAELRFGANEGVFVDSGFVQSASEQRNHSATVDPRMWRR